MSAPRDFKVESISRKKTVALGCRNDGVRTGLRKKGPMSTAADFVRENITKGKRVLHSETKTRKRESISKGRRFLRVKAKTTEFFGIQKRPCKLPSGFQVGGTFSKAED